MAWNRASKKTGHIVSMYTATIRRGGISDWKAEVFLPHSEASSDLKTRRGWYFEVGTGSNAGCLLKTRNADDFGQLVTNKVLEKVVSKAGDPENIKHSAWSSGRSRADALRTSELRTLEEIVKTPFVSSYYQLGFRVLSQIMNTSLMQEQLRSSRLPHSPKEQAPPLVSGQRYNLKLHPTALFALALRYQRRRPLCRSRTLLPLTRRT